MKIGSVFSGGGGGDLGFKKSGHTISFGCEIDPDARAILRKQNPDLFIFNDIREISVDRLISERIEIPEAIFGGSPCQDLSVAGSRKGLGGEQSGLFIEQVRLADEIEAKWFIWENVAGVFSSNKGEDFAEVLGRVTGFRPSVPRTKWQNSGVCLGPRRVAVWRVLDAQAFGVPQRRRRVFLIAGPRGMESRVVEILFECESSRRNPSEGRAKEKEDRGEIEGRIGTSSAGRLTDISQSILSRYGSRGDLETETFVLENIPYAAFDSNYSGHFDIVNDGKISPTLRVGSKSGAGYPPAIGVGDTIRRLTPVECERLMGWPENYTEIGIDDNFQYIKLSNSKRYKICGNGIVSNVTKWIGNRLPNE